MHTCAACSCASTRLNLSSALPPVCAVLDCFGTRTPVSSENLNRSGRCTQMLPLKADAPCRAPLVGCPLPSGPANTSPPRSIVRRLACFSLHKVTFSCEEPLTSLRLFLSSLYILAPPIIPSLLACEHSLRSCTTPGPAAIMPGGGPTLSATTDTSRIEAPVTFKAYLMCAFAASPRPQSLTNCQL